MECPHCLEKSVVKVHHHCQEQTVCESCGAVISDTDFVAGEANGEFVGQSSEKQFAQIPWEKRRMFYKSTCATVKSGVERIKYLSSTLNMSSTDEASATELFKKCVADARFNRLHLEKKKALSVCCVYIILRQNHQPVTKSQICSLAGVSASLFHKIIEKLKPILNLEITTTSMEETIPGFLKDSRVEDKSKVIAKTKKILDLCRKVWLTQSRKPESVIGSCIYLAWSSLDINQRVKVTYTQFCKKYNVKYSPCGNLRCTEIEDVFRKLGEKLPWISKDDMKKKRYLLHCIDRILENSNWLLHSLVGSDSDAETFKTFFPPNECKNKSPDVIRPPSPILKAVSDSVELSEADIPDDEMHLYIRSESEVQSVKLFNNKHESC